MASVAGCPQCSHELLIPGDADPVAWAKCPACNALFQVQDAAARKVAEVVLVDAGSLPAEVDEAAATLPMREVVRQIGPTRTVTMSSAKTLGDVGSFGGDHDVALVDADAGEAEGGDAANPEKRTKRSAPTIVDIAPTTAATWEENADAASPVVDCGETPTERIERSFQSAKAVAEIRPMDSPAELNPLPSTIPLVAIGAADDAAEPNRATRIEMLDLPAQDVLPAVQPAEPVAADANAATDAAEAPVWTPSARPDATIEFSGEVTTGGDADFELEPAADAPAVTPTWDDSEHMERLLAGDNDRRADDAAPEDAPPGNEPFVSIAPTYDMPSGKRRRRRPSIVRTLVGVAVAGVVGTAIGYYILLAMSGPSGDFLEVAQYLPSSVLPGSFSPKTYQAGKETVATGDAAEKQASFESPLGAASSQPDEPQTFTPTEADPIDDADAPRVAGAPSYTSDELAAALQAAREAQAGLMAGRLTDSDEVRRAKGVSFSMLSDLAEKATFVDVASADAALEQEADALFRESLSDARIRGEVARIVPLWIGSKHRTHGGIFFAGTVVDQAKRGQLIEYRCELGAGEPLMLLMPASLAGQLEESARPVGVVGSLVDRPADSISGYDGTTAQIVWVSRLIELD